MTEPLCLTCKDTGWNPDGSWCQNCARGRQNYETVGVRNPATQNHRNAHLVATDKHEMPELDLRPALPGIVPDVSDEHRTPAATARALKASLYVIVIVVTCLFVHFFGDGAEPNDDDVLDFEPDSPGPTPSDAYSTWEPEV
jgi:hypothetical protein